jgi:hypothetical protein
MMTIGVKHAATTIDAALTTDGTAMHERVIAAPARIFAAGAFVARILVARILVARAFVALTAVGPTAVRLRTTVVEMAVARMNSGAARSIRRSPLTIFQCMKWHD